MPRGPLPQQQRRRRNAPTIPTTMLPVEGRSGPVPRPPKWAVLGVNGQAWWRWAWKTPQAAGWAPGHESVVARRASLEDDLHTLETFERVDWTSLLGLPEDDAVKELRFLVERLHGLATGRLQVMREMRELDDRLGFTPRGLAALRWQVVAADEPVGAESEQQSVSERRERLKVV
jgi:hypothetical protein